MADTDHSGGGTDTLERELEELLNKEQVEEGDHERFSHYAPKNKIMGHGFSSSNARVARRPRAITMATLNAR